MGASLTFVATKVSPGEISVRFSEEGFLDHIAKEVSAMLYATKAAAQHAGFAKLVSDS